MLAAVCTAAALSCVPYYTGREARQLQQAQQALVRTASGVLGGVACGAGLHSAADAFVPLAPWTSALDGVVDTAAGGLFGAILGVLWASEAALLRSGWARAYMRDSLGPLMQNASAEESLEKITLGMSTMASRGDAALRVAYFLTGLDEASADEATSPVESILEAARQGLPPDAAPSAEAVAAAYERVLEEKLLRARLLYSAQGLGLGLAAHGALWGVGAAVGEVLRTARTFSS